MNESGRIEYEMFVSQLRGSPLLKALDLPSRRGNINQYSCPFFIPSGKLKFVPGIDRADYYNHLNTDIPNKNLISASIPNAFVVVSSDKGQRSYLIQYLSVNGIEDKERGLLYKARIHSIGKNNIEVAVREGEGPVNNVFVKPEQCNVVGTLHIISSSEESRVTYLAKEKLNLFMERDNKIIEENSSLINLAPNAFMPLSDTMGAFGYIGMYGYLIE